MATTPVIIKYEMGKADSRERVSFNYEFPQKIYVVLT